MGRVLTITPGQWHLSLARACFVDTIGRPDEGIANGSANTFPISLLCLALRFLAVLQFSLAGIVMLFLFANLSFILNEPKSPENGVKIKGTFILNDGSFLRAENGELVHEGRMQQTWTNDSVIYLQNGFGLAFGCVSMVVSYLLWQIGSPDRRFLSTPKGRTDLIVNVSTFAILVFVMCGSIALTMVLKASGSPN